MRKQKIVPHLWYDKEAVEAANFYVSVFGKNSKITSSTELNNTPSGSVDVVTFNILGYEFQAISAGPIFKLNPSVSFHVVCSSKDKVDEIWKKLTPGGQILMELGSYPFSERYGWIQDKYGLSWQIIYIEGRNEKIIPAIMFVGKICGKAEEAINYWISVFKDSPSPTGESKINNIMRRGANEAPDKEGTVTFASFSLSGQEFGIMDSAYEHKFAFNEAVSFLVRCDTQEEIDYFWQKLSAVPAAEQCGWLKDKYGLSWQIVPSIMDKMMADKNPETIARVTEAFLKMKKFDIAKLEEAYNQK